MYRLSAKRKNHSSKFQKMRRHEMKERFLSVLLALAMLLSLMPSAAFGEENEGGSDDSEIVY